MSRIIRIGTRESQLAVWQATRVKELLQQNGFDSELVYIKSEGDIDLQTPLYEMGVQGIFTRSLDFALLNNRIDLAVHSMKDVPTQLPASIVQAAVLKRGPVHDLLVWKGDWDRIQEALGLHNGKWLSQKEITNIITLVIATSSIRRKAQWLHRYPHHVIENLRGNVNTRLKKLENERWDAAIFALAGLERIQLRPENSIVLDWMLPAPAQGAIMVVAREEDKFSREACLGFNDEHTAICTKLERDFLRTLLGGCSTPISALANIQGDKVNFRGNILSIDGRERIEIEKSIEVSKASNLGKNAAEELLTMGGYKIAESIKNSG